MPPTFNYTSNCPLIYRYRLLFILVLLIGNLIPGFTQSPIPSTSKGTYVDDQGVIRWTKDKAEVKGFGVNYTVPFAHAYRSAIKLDINPLEAIDEDVYHFARLGFDLYRVHVWDTEISDTLGNLQFNEHLNAFDYLLKKLGERNINYVLTPIAFWGNGWPEPDEATPGFSAKYGKDACLTNEAAIKAQENYLYQFFQHVNPYTGIAYKDDPRLIALEISNEPHHREAPEQVTAFIQRMVNAVRKTGCEKPIFYNISHSVHLAKDYFKAAIQGGTFQWYPTGLGYQQELSANILPNVDQYLIPFDGEIKKNKAAKLVYEFDLPDIGKSYAYPAAARSFRKAGIQIATQFSYDPTFLAYANTEYNTHYMNLAYTPQKALSLMIASEVFHRVPMYKDFGTYPQDTLFDGFTLSYQQDLALLNVPDKFYYTNHTTAIPVQESSLQHIAGSGNSPVVEYEGTGAYFLDQLEAGIWRLEVMPDALVVRNPYGRNSLKKEVAVIQWNSRQMKIKYSDLGNDFAIAALDEGNTSQNLRTSDGRFTVSPGVYLLSKNGKNSKWKTTDFMGRIRLDEFHAPQNTVKKTYVVHKKAEVAMAGKALNIEAKVISPDPDLQVQILVDGMGSSLIDMQHHGGFTYQATIPADRITKGFFRYYLLVKSGNKTETFPADQTGHPYDWNFYARNPYTVKVVDPQQSVYLFNANDDAANLSYTRWLNTLRLVPLDQPGEAEYQINVEQLQQPDPENLKATIVADYTVRYYVNGKVETIRNQLSAKEKLVFKARSLNGKAEKVQVALVMNDGVAYGKIIELQPTLQNHEILLSDLQQVDLVLMPRPYPTFLPYYFSNNNPKVFDLREVEGLQISIGLGMAEKELGNKHGMAIVSVALE